MQVGQLRFNLLKYKWSAVMNTFTKRRVQMDHILEKISYLLLSLQLMQANHAHSIYTNFIMYQLAQSILWKRATGLTYIIVYTNIWHSYTWISDHLTLPLLIARIRDGANLPMTLSSMLKLSRSWCENWGLCRLTLPWPSIFSPSGSCSLRWKTED